MPQTLNAQDIRTLFLEFFKNQGHEIVPSSSLVPGNDPTLLFTNAGMVQFKSTFLGTEPRPYHRAVSSQRCVRAGGKHNDLERVGYTARHHTFFEMLGNFSFGDYFKSEAIHFAWNFLTKTLHLPKEKLWVTVYHEDLEAEKIWLNDIKVDPTRFSRLGEDSNFWAMGATGPCGPCTEIFYDHGPTVVGGPPGSPNEDGDRYVEIWNLVFMQYNRDEAGNLIPLPKPSVDTGMGLERITAVMQGLHNNYDTDLFQPLIQFTAALANISDLTHTSLRVIADHIRSAAFLMADGVIPSNEGRGYVLRRIIRRALRHGAKLGLNEPFFYQLVKPLVNKMGAAYPELKKAEQQISTQLRREEEQFSLTLSQGMKLFEEAIAKISGHIIPGDIVFKLYDTYGFPMDLTADMARERGLTVDEAGFEAAMTIQRDRSRSAGQFDVLQTVSTETLTPTDFIGYKNLLTEKTPDEAKILSLFQDGKPVTSLTAGQRGAIVLDRTPFYAESGGQIGDQGRLTGAGIVFEVTDTQKQGSAHLHIGTLKQGGIKTGDTLTAEVDAKRRSATVLNHTATHLLHHVLRSLFGEHVVQKGSLVTPEKLRFDFSHTAPLTPEELEKIERAVNARIRSNSPAHVHETTPAKAVEEGAMALFGEKYGDTVRVVRFGDSVELCGGTHAHHTGDIGIFCITSESGIAAGIRRIEAVTGEGALEWIKQTRAQDQSKIQDAEAKARELEKQIQQLKDKQAVLLSGTLKSKANFIEDIAVLIEKVNDMDSRSLRSMVDQLKSELKNAVIVLASVSQGRVSIVAGVTQPLTKALAAGEIVKMLAEMTGGKGGGRPDLAEAGGGAPEKLDKALGSVMKWITEKLNSSSHTNAKS